MTTLSLPSQEGSKKYIKEVLTLIETIFGTLRKYDNPSETGNNPELDDSWALGNEEHRQYQILIGTLIWVVGLGRSDVAHATSSLSRFSACPREGHLARALRVFGFLKKRPNTISATTTNETRKDAYV